MMNEYDEIDTQIRGMDIPFILPRDEYHKMIMSGEWIPKDLCVPFGVYICDARNFNIGIWNGNEFEYMRTKFGDTFLDTELHWDDGAPFGTAKPMLLVWVKK